MKAQGSSTPSVIIYWTASRSTSRVHPISIFQTASRLPSDLFFEENFDYQKLAENHSGSAGDTSKLIVESIPITGGESGEVFHASRVVN